VSDSDSDSDEPTGLFSHLGQTFGSQSDAVHTGLVKQPDEADAATGLIKQSNGPDAATGLIGQVNDPDAPTGLIRRTPTGSIPVADAPPTSIIRRTPTGAMPVVDAQATGLIAATPSAKPAKPPRSIPKPPAMLTAACATATAAILSGWATAVMATMLIAGYWRSDQLFCVAVGFLTAVSFTATIGGQIAVLLRRRTGRILVIVGSVVALLIFASLFIAGATLPTAAYAIPVLPLAAIVLAALPATGHWCIKS